MRVHCLELLKSIPLPHVAAWILSGSLLVLGAGMVLGQAYPNKPIRIVTGEPGGVNDLVVRLMVQGLSNAMGQNFIAENRPSNLFGELVAKAAPDGYTLLIAGGSFLIGPLLQDTPYDPVRDFSPITMLVRSPNVLVVHPSLPVKSAKELIALAKARPGALNYSSGGTGGAPHIAAELFKNMAGVDIVRVPYKGGGPALNALIGGEVQLMFNSVSAVTPHVSSSKLRALAVGAAEPSALAPGLPTVAASGLPGYESGFAQGIWAPAKTPQSIIVRLNGEIVRVLNQPDVKQKFFDMGTEVVGNTPEEYIAMIKSELATMSKVIKAAGIRVQ